VPSSTSVSSARNKHEGIYDNASQEPCNFEYLLTTHCSNINNAVIMRAANNLLLLVIPSDR